MVAVHTPVMSNEVIAQLVPFRADALIVDGTLGEGGHSMSFLRTYPQCRVIGIDIDPAMGARAMKLLEEQSQRFELMTGWSDEILVSWVKRAPDIILLDLGVSRFHYECSGRGFSFRGDEPLDMRLDESGDRNAADLVNSLEEDDLANLIFTYGEERYSRRIARNIVVQRRKAPITNTGRLARVVLKAIPGRVRHGRIHAATRTFQALRIVVNRELDRLATILNVAPDMLAARGRLGIISFHSLEDRLVKRCYRAKDKRYGGDCHILTRKPLLPSAEECRSNPSSRTAKFRVLEKASAGDSP